MNNKSAKSAKSAKTPELKVLRFEDLASVNGGFFADDDMMFASKIDETCEKGKTDKGHEETCKSVK